MREQWQVAVPVQVTAWCECGGEMEHTGITYTVMPPVNEHRCKSCGRTETTTETYPRIDHKRAGRRLSPEQFDFPDHRS